MHLRWRNPAKRRYYVAHLTRDLLGDWILIRVWGSLDSAHGRVMQMLVADHDTGTSELEKISRRRERRGYERVRLDRHLHPTLATTQGFRVSHVHTAGANDLAVEDSPAALAIDRIKRR